MELARFFDQSLDLLCIAGFDGHFKGLNPAWTVRLGWTLDELLERPFLDFVHPEDREASEAELATLAAGTDTIFFENRCRHRDGSHRWLQWNARPVPGCNRIYAAGRDVTRRKRQEREILEIADREKARLGRELHDGLCQGLAGIAALSATLSRRLARRSDPSASTAAEITELLNEAMHEARELARGLDPAGLRSGGLTAALERAADNTERLFRVACSLTCSRPLPRLRREDEEHLFRIAQEAVRNAVAHARCGRIEIELSHADGRGLLSVRDDGVGLPNGASLAEGIGLHTMAYRARLIGASLEVRRRAGGGTVASCSFPLSEPAVPSETDPPRKKEQPNGGESD